MTAVLREASEVLERDAFLRACLEINPTDLNYEFIKAPGELAYWTEQLATATYVHATAKLNYDRERGRLFVLLRNKFEEGSKRPLSLELIGARCDEDAELFDLQMDVIKADAERMRLRGIVDAVGRKADMLQSLGAKLREEARGGPQVRNREENERALTGP